MLHKDLTSQESRKKSAPTLLSEIEESINEHELPLRSSYPITSMQQRLWLLWKLEPEIPYCTHQSLAYVNGNIDCPLLLAAVNIVTSNNVFTNARFTEIKGCTEQTFKTPHEEVVVRDLSAIAPDNQQQRIKQLAQKIVSEVTNITESVFRVHIFKLSGNEYNILFTWHEIVADQKTIDLLIKEITEVYKALSEGTGNFSGPKRGHYLPPVSKEYTNDETYWKSKLKGELPILSLSLDSQPNSSPGYRGNSAHVTLDTSITNALKSVSSSGWFDALLTAYYIFLYRYSGQKEIIVGMPIVNRNNPGEDHMKGNFENVIPLRISFHETSSFRDLLTLVSETVREGRAHGIYPFSQMLQHVASTRNGSTAPIFQTMFGQQDASWSWQDDDLKITTTRLDTGFTKYMLSLDVGQNNGQIILTAKYHNDHFSSDTIRRMLANFSTLVTSIIQNPNAAVSSLELLHPEEKSKLYEFRQQTIHHKNNQDLYSMFREQAERTPSQVAYIFEDTSICYRELNEKVNHLTSQLLLTGITKSTLVGLYLEKSIDMAAVILAIVKVCAVYIPLNPLHPASRSNEILQAARPAFLIESKQLPKVGDNYTGKKIFLHEILNAPPSQVDQSALPPAGPDDLINIVYTSSSTGKPKGVMITRKSVVNRLNWMWNSYPFQATDVAVWHKSYTLVASTWEFFGALLKGIPTVILSHEDSIDPVQLWHKLLSHNVSYFLATPSLYKGIVEQAKRSDKSWTTLRIATTSAEPISSALAKEWTTTFPNIPLLNLYGSTECSSNVTEYRIDQAVATLARIPIGKPLSNTTIYIVDEHLNELPLGVIGEMCISGDCVARGYLNLPDMSKHSFIVNPFTKNNDTILYRSGDLARYLPDGNIELIGRKDHQVKIRGFRIELAEVENSLLQHKNVKECCVIVQEQAADQQKLVAFIAPHQQQSNLYTELLDFLRQRLPNYMIPSLLVMMDKIPVNTAGKIDRLSLSKTDLKKPELLNTYVAPFTETEKKLKKIWSRNLGVASIGIHDNFFDLGGDSLMMTLVNTQIKDEFNRTFTYRTILENPTIKQQAELLERTGGIGDRAGNVDTTPRWKYLKSIRTTGSKPAVFAIPSGLLYQNVIRHLGDDQPFYCFDPLYDDDVKEAAEKYLSELIECQPEGPYFLAGYCLHGLVAYEMAQMLRARGQTTGLLILFETFERSTVIPKTSFWFYPKKLMIYTHRFRTISWSEKYKFIAKSLKSIVGPAQVDKSNARKRSYKPEIYTGDVVLFKSEEAEVVTIDAPYMGWKPYVTGSLELHQTPGTHIGIMYGDKYAKIMSSKVNECLQKAYLKHSI